MVMKGRVIVLRTLHSCFLCVKGGGKCDRFRPKLTDFSAIREKEAKSVKNDRFFQICDRKQIFSGFRTKICHFWQILAAKSVISKSVKFDRFWTQNLSNLTDCRFFQDFWPKSVIFDRFWQQNLSFWNLSNLTDFELKICQIWQKTDFFGILDQNLSFLTDFGNWQVQWRFLKKSVTFPPIGAT